VCVCVCVHARARACTKQLEAAWVQSDPAQWRTSGMILPFTFYLRLYHTYNLTIVLLYPKQEREC